MPPSLSLRRSFSAPSARSSPYSTSLGDANRSRVRSGRLPSGSQTCSRRILAELEWWRVAEGQRELRQEFEDSNDGDEQRRQDVVQVETVPTLDLDWSVHSTGSSEISRDWASVLLVVPQTPRRRRVHPDYLEPSIADAPGTAPVEGIHRGMAALGLGARPPIVRIASPVAHRAPAPLFRAHTLNGAPSLHDDTVAHTSVSYVEFPISTNPWRQPDLFN